MEHEGYCIGYPWQKTLGHVLAASVGCSTRIPEDCLQSKSIHRFTLRGVLPYFAYESPLMRRPMNLEDEGGTDFLPFPLFWNRPKRNGGRPVHAFVFHFHRTSRTLTRRCWQGKTAVRAAADNANSVLPRERPGAVSTRSRCHKKHTGRNRHRRCAARPTPPCATDCDRLRSG